MKKKYILAMDEGTTSARAAVFDIEKNELVNMHSIKIGQIYPANGWVEQDANEIYSAQIAALEKCLEMGLGAHEIVGLALSNQRETVVAWDRISGQLIYNAINWQCRRTAKVVAALSAEQKTLIHQKTGLIPDAYFSATKMRWIYDNVPKAKELEREKRLCMGTIDSFLLYRLTGEFVTDATNASRTMLYNIKEGKWDKELLSIFGVKKEWLAEVVDSNCVIGKTTLSCGKVDVAGILGDQQAALFGQCCFEKGMVKNTYGTGCFMLANIGDTLENTSEKLLTTVAYQIDGKVTYAYEGSVFNAGSIITWLKDGLKIFGNTNQIEELASRVRSSNGVYFIPALTGLGSPYWDSSARGAFLGLDRGTSRSHMIRACLEAVAFRAEDIMQEMRDSGIEVTSLRCDGGMTNNGLLMQLQADLSRVDILIPRTSESTILGACFMCALSMGTFKSLDDIAFRWVEGARFLPGRNVRIQKDYKKWKRAVAVARKWRV